MNKQDMDWHAENAYSPVCSRFGGFDRLSGVSLEWDDFAPDTMCLTSSTPYLVPSFRSPPPFLFCDCSGGDSVWCSTIMCYLMGIHILMELSAKLRHTYY